MNNRGVTLVELLVSAAIISVVTLSLFDFSMNVLNAAEKHTHQLENIKGSRLSMERITEQINDAVYIFPMNKDLSFSVAQGFESFETESVNTNNAVGLLIPFTGNDTLCGTTPCYNFVVFYLKQIGDTDYYDLYEFSTAYPSVEWEENTIPSVSGQSGTETLLATNVQPVRDSITYILNYNDSPTDKILKGAVRDALVDDDDALIRGVEWVLSMKKPNGESVDINIRGISKNVPRFFM